MFDSSRVFIDMEWLGRKIRRYAELGNRSGPNIVDAAQVFFDVDVKMNDLWDLATTSSHSKAVICSLQSLLILGTF